MKGSATFVQGTGLRCQAIDEVTVKSIDVFANGSRRAKLPGHDCGSPERLVYMLQPVMC